MAEPTRQGSTLAFARALVATNLKAAFALRAAFWMQVAFMILNNLIFFTFWWLAFQRVDHVGGWRLTDLCALYGLVAGSFGLAMVLGGGVRELARAIQDGELDTWLTQPQPVLLQALGGRSHSAGWGDLVSSVLLLWWSGYCTGAGWVLIPLAVLGGAVVFLATGVLLQSLAFWLGPVDTLARQMFEWVITTAVYPGSIYTGPIRWLMFVVLPAAFVSQLPVTLLRAFDWPTVGLWLGGVTAYALFAHWWFARGLRAYTSGNRFVARG